VRPGVTPSPAQSAGEGRGEGSASPYPTVSNSKPASFAALRSNVTV
jgi:hypothetical protein